MMPLHVPTQSKPAALARGLFKLERNGKYEEALKELTDIWPDFDLDPEIGSFEIQDAAEILLRCGCLIGFHGHIAQIPNSQLRSKDLLTNARERFLSLKNFEKAAECENYVALALWRTREFNEAEIWIEEALARQLPILSDTRLYSHIAKSMVDRSFERYEEIFANLKKLEPEFLRYGDAFLTGSFYTNIALALKNLGNKSEAIGHFELARYYHQRSRHKIYLGTVENKLAQIYKETGKFSRAHESIDNATRIFKQLKDKTREGFSLDTKALIYFAESKYNDALRTVEKALLILGKSENFGYLIETLLTKAKILLHLDKFSAAVLSLIEAVNVARVQTGEESAVRLINDFETELKRKNEPVTKTQPAAEDLELIMPPSLARYQDYRGVWMTNDHLKNIGLDCGSLGIVVSEKINRGDLAAVTELESDQVICGFYDADFGIVCLETPSGDPQFFDEINIRILGKIVGVCQPGTLKDGKMAVEVLSI